MNVFLKYVKTLLIILSFISLNAFKELNSESLPCNGYVYTKDEHNCSWFYRCDITGRSQHLECYPGLFFNEMINDCDVPQNVPECAEYPFLCQFLSLCWPPIISISNSSLSNSTSYLNGTEI